MRKFRAPSGWKEKDYKEAISALILESGNLLAKGKYDESAKSLVMAAYIIKEIPSFKRKILHASDVNDQIKKVREKKFEKEKLLEEQREKEEENKSPFNIEQ